MKADDPGAVMRTCGLIEDGLANLEHLLVKAVKDDIRLGEFLKTERYNLRSQIPEEFDTNDKVRDAWVEGQIRQSPDFTLWVDAHADRRAIEAQSDNLGTRLTACQSVLKRLEREVGSPGTGAGQKNI